MDLQQPTLPGFPIDYPNQVRIAWAGFERWRDHPKNKNKSTPTQDELAGIISCNVRTLQRWWDQWSLGGKLNHRNVDWLPRWPPHRGDVPPWERGPRAVNIEPSQAVANDGYHDGEVRLMRIQKTQLGLLSGPDDRIVTATDLADGSVWIRAGGDHGPIHAPLPSTPGQPRVTLVVDSDTTKDGKKSSA